MKKNNMLLVAIAVLFAILGIMWGNYHLRAEAPEASATSKLFASSMKDVLGQSQNLSQWKNKPLIVNFWATWCAPCVQEMPELSALQTEIAPRNIQIIGIGIDSATNIAEFASKYKISYPLYVGGLDASELSRQLGNQAGGLPFTLLISRDGKVKKAYLGRLKISELRKDLASL
jgi:thiol-disulfide isomerase/thioredoxin